VGRWRRRGVQAAVEVGARRECMHARGCGGDWTAFGAASMLPSLLGSTGTLGAAQAVLSPHPLGCTLLWFSVPARPPPLGGEGDAHLPGEDRKDALGLLLHLCVEGITRANVRQRRRGESERLVALRGWWR